MPISSKNVQLRNKIIAGVKKAMQKLIEESAVKNETLVLSVNGKPTHVPAKELLRQQR